MAAVGTSNVSVGSNLGVGVSPASASSGRGLSYARTGGTRSRSTFSSLLNSSERGSIRGVPGLLRERGFATVSGECGLVLICGLGVWYGG